MTRAERDWREPVVKRLGLVAQIFADALGRKRSDEALRQGQERMALAAAAAGAGLWELDLLTGRFWATEKARDLVGLPQDVEPSYERCLDLVHPEDRDLVDQAVAAALDSRSDRHVECRIVRPDGSIRWIHSAGRVRCNESGDPVSIMGASTDVTARKQAESALQEATGRLIIAQEKERAWLAKELHDGLSQNLALLAVELDLLGQLPPKTADELTARTAELSAQTRALSGEVHRLSHGLHPAKLERLGLVAALGGLCREMEVAEQLTVRFQAQMVPRNLPEDVVLCLYRVAQEALWNVVKHSGATQAMVGLSGSADDIQLRIEDDGRGFDPGSPASYEGLGLLSMRERIGMVRGQIMLESGKGDGTTVWVRVPLPGYELP
jgi:signal transduction histidine kinase